MAKAQFKSWDQPLSSTRKPQTGGKPAQNSDLLPFITLDEGDNTVRIITSYIEYRIVRVEDPQKKEKYGIKVRCSELASQKGTKVDGVLIQPWKNCPTFQAGYRAKVRLVAGAIHRKAGKQYVGVFDMNSMLFEGLEKIISKKGDPTTYDLTVIKDSNSKTPAGLFTPMYDERKELSPEDLALIEAAGGIEKIEAALERFAAPHSVERVTARLMALGWDGKVVDMDEKYAKKDSNKGELEETKTEDYEFNRPVSAVASDV